VSRPRWWHRVARWVAERLYLWVPAECGLMSRTGDVYCTLPDGHDGPHGWERVL
jgi:hypothetical protein